jgi:hypothetical protein
MRLNKLIREYAHTRRGIVLADFYAVCVDPLSATSNYKSGYTDDGLHLSAAGAYAAGLELYNALNTAGLVPRGPIEEAYSIDESYGTDSDCKQLIDNPLLTLDAGTATSPATGTVATEWTLARVGTPTSVTGSLVERSDGFGNNQRVICEADAVSEGWTLTSTNYSGRIPAGSTIWGSVRVTADDTTKLQRLYMHLAVTSGGELGYPSARRVGSATVHRNDETRLVTPKITLSAAANVYMVINCYHNAANTVTVDVGRPNIWIDG